MRPFPDSQLPFFRNFLLLLVLLGGCATLSGFTSKSQAEGMAQSTPEVGGMQTRFPGIKGDMIYNLPADASQVDYGREAYRLVCSACHGDKGQGLTAQWRLTWNPKDQN